MFQECFERAPKFPWNDSICIRYHFDPLSCTKLDVSEILCLRKLFATLRNECIYIKHSKSFAVFCRAYIGVFYSSNLIFLLKMFSPTRTNF